MICEPSGRQDRRVKRGGVFVWSNNVNVAIDGQKYPFVTVYDANKESLRVKRAAIAALLNEMYAMGSIPPPSLRY